MAGAAPKKYGLIVPPKKSKGVPAIKKPSVFEESSSDEEADVGVRAGKKAGKSSLWRENKKNAMQMESHGSVLKALEDDPTVFEYDSLYDDMQEQKRRADPRLAKKDRTSKYISKLKKVADRRKLEQDIIYERKVQREMEEEGLEYGDKDTFLTSAYRKKLEERKLMEEELKEAAKREEAQDVRKQTDLSRFHRNLLEHITDSTPGKNEREEEKSKPPSSEERANQRVDEEARERDGRRRAEEEEGQRRTHDEGDDRHHSTSSRSGERRDSPEPIRQSTSDAEEKGGMSEAEGRERTDSSSSVPANEEDAPQGKEVVTTSLFPVKVDKEALRKVAAAKRTNEDSLGSARERYLARKKAKLTAPVISDD